MRFMICFQTVDEFFLKIKGKTSEMRGNDAMFVRK